jgi:hypothetical protein
METDSWEDSTGSGSFSELDLKLAPSKINVRPGGVININNGLMD